MMISELGHTTHSRHVENPYLGFLFRCYSDPYIGNGAAVFVSRMMAARGLPEADHARLHSAFIDLYDDATAFTVIYPGVLDALDALAAAGYVMGVCTNKPLSPARAVLAHFGLLGRFACVVGGDSLAHHKPHPAPLLHAYGLLGAKDHLYVGDSEIDYQTAIAAAVPFAFYTEGYRKSPLSDFPGALPFADFAALPGIAEQIFA